MSDGQDAVASWRAVVDEAHALVARGAYDEALSRFRRAHLALAGLLGADHPEVEELADDAEACRSMGELYAFGKASGFRWQDQGVPLPADPPDDEG